MTKDELRDGIRKSFSSIDERTLFWKYIGQLEKRIAELEAENKYLGNMPIMKVKAPEAVIYENALNANRELAITVNTQQNRIKELEAMSIDEFELMKHQQEFGNG